MNITIGFIVIYLAIKNYSQSYMKLTRIFFIVLMIHLLGGFVRAATPAFDLAADQPGKLKFSGSQTAELFSKEIDPSFQGALALDYVAKFDGTYPAGFIHASPISQPWHGTMWTRDAGTFMRELVFWGDYEHACQLAQCVMDFVATDSNGFIAFARYFKPENGRLPGTEMDGQAATIISMIALWQRLPASDPFRAQLYHFLHQNSSPVRGIHYLLQHNPLVPGSGEFGGGNGRDPYFNVVQNNLCALALLSAADMEDATGEHADAKLWRKDAKTIFHNIEKYLLEPDGSFLWCVNPKTMKPGRGDHISNSGSGSFNGVTSMSADVLGLDPTNWPWQGALKHGEKTFDDLYSFPPRKAQFEKYGIWPQMNYTHQGLLTSPSYGQGYALQDMLVFDKLDMADHGLDFLAQFTFKSPGVVFSYQHDHYGRLSPYYFYERMYSPDAQGKMEMTAGCGPLNLVNVSEPLKVARLIAGIDDTSGKQVQIIPRLPPSWSGYHAENWPIRTDHGIVRADISYEKIKGSVNFSLQVKQGGPIPKLAVRLPEKNKMTWIFRNNVTEFSFKSPALN
jgi:hypothetical protein